VAVEAGAVARPPFPPDMHTPEGAGHKGGVFGMQWHWGILARLHWLTHYFI
jgi:hypothetical protein